MSETSPTPSEPAAEEPLAGLVAQFTSPEALKKAAARVRDEGYTRWDAHSPFPVHGIERAMGVRRTILPWLVLGAGISGGMAAILLQWWTNAFDYPHIISGKPLFSLPANIPVTFELIVLLSGLTAFLGNLVLNKLPEFSHATFRSERFRRVTTDGFFISLDATDPKFDEAAARALLESAGAAAVDACRVAAPARLPAVVGWALLVLGVLATLPPVLTLWYRSIPKRSPRIHLIQDMDFQPKYKTQAASPLFADRRAMRPPVEGTVAVGRLREDEYFHFGRTQDGWARSLPMEPTDELIERGRQRFDIYCAVCHGYDGAGGGIVSKRAIERMEPDWATPVSFHSNAVRQQADGQLFHTITGGAGKMPGYAALIEPADRWSIVLYIRALQLSRNAAAGDVPDEIRRRLP